MVQGMQQTVGGNRCPTRPFGRIDNQYSHSNVKITKSYMYVSYINATFF